jgi:hypothetical protein
LSSAPTQLRQPQLILDGGLSQSAADDRRRNDTAEACALKLAKAGKRAEALEVAKTIMSQRQQDSVLSKLAK